MGKGSKSKSKSTSASQSGSGQSWAQPYAAQGVQNINSVFDANQPQLEALTQQSRDLIPALTSNFNKSSGAANMASGYNSDVVSGKYLTGNPYMDKMIAQMRGGITDQVNGQFSLGGRYGSGAHTGVLANKLGEMETGLRYGDYSQERDRMGQASAQAQSASNQDIQALLANLGLTAEMPYTGSNNLANSLGALFSGGNEQSSASSTQRGAGLMSGLMGAGATLGSALISRCDERLKENIELVHIDPDGLPFYAFDYKPGFGLPEGRQVNPMAQDVAKYRPWALGPEVDGYMTIYPGRL